MVTTSKMEKYLSNREEPRGSNCSKLKKGNSKTKRLLKITLLDEQEASVQPTDITKAGNMYSPKPGNCPLNLKICQNFVGIYIYIYNFNNLKIFTREL